AAEAPEGQALHALRAGRAARARQPAGHVAGAVQRAHQGQGPGAGELPGDPARRGRGGEHVGAQHPQLQGGSMTARWPLLGIVLAACVAGTSAGAARADFRDGTIFSDTAANGRLDVGPLFLFRSPANANNTVFVMTVSPFTGVLTPVTFVKGARYDIAIDTSGDAIEDMVLRTTFGPPSANDASQSVLVRCLPRPRCRRYVVARGRTGQNIPVPGGGMFRAANQDIPEFFDQGGFETRMSTGAGFPRPAGTAKNFYGPNANSLALVLELPSNR